RSSNKSHLSRIGEAKFHPDLEDRKHLLLRPVPPEPAQGVGKDRSPVLWRMATVTKLELIVISRELQRRSHVLVRKRPVPVKVIEVVCAVLQEYSERLRFVLRLPNLRGVDVAAADVG